MRSVCFAGVCRVGAIAVFSAVAVLAAGRGSAAEPADTGQIAGVVKDKNSGEAIEGALVILQCTCIQGVRETRTNASGLYSFSELPQGKYTVQVVFSSANTAKVFDLPRGEKVRAGFTIDAGSDKPTILRVIPKFLKSPGPRREINLDDFARVPNAGGTRDFTQVLDGLPGAQRVPGGIVINSHGPAEQQYTLGGGVSFNNPRFGTVGSSIVQDFLESIEVLESGYEAEFGNASGGQIRLRRQSGSNTFRGQARFTFTPRLARPRFIQATDNAIRAIEVPDYQIQGVVRMSGPIIKDRLFWSAGINMTGGRGTLTQSFYRRLDKDGSGGYEGCPHQNGQFDCVPGGDYIATRKFAEQSFRTAGLAPQFFAGIDWAITPRHRIEATLFGTPSFLRRSYRRAASANFDPSAFGTSFNADPVGGGSLVANGIVNGLFGWDRANATTAELNYKGRVAKDRIEIDATLGLSESVSQEAWRLDNPAAKRQPAIQESDAQGTDLYKLLDRDSQPALLKLAEGACNDSSLPGLTCPVRSWLSGGIGNYSYVRNRSVQGLVSLTHFFNAAGAHQLKYGARVEHQQDSTFSRYSGENASDFYGNCGPGQSGGGEYCYDRGDNNYVFRGDGRVDNHRFVLVDSDNPESRATRGYGRARLEQGQLRAIATPLGAGIRADAYRARVSTQNYAIYLQDRWMPYDGLSVSAGVRWEMQDMRDVMGRRALLIWDNVAPRLGISYLSEDGRSRVFANYGFFYQPLPLQLNSRVFGGLVQVGRTYRNSDCANGVPVVDNGGIEHPRAVDGRPTEYCKDADSFTTGLTQGAVVPRLRGQYSRQLGIGYEQEVIEDLTLGVRWVHEDLGRAVEDISTDGGNNYIIANPGESVSGDDISRQRRHCEELAADLKAAEGDDDRRAEIAREKNRCDFLVDAYRAVGRDFARPRRTYDAFTFEVNKRLARNWMIVASYTYSRLIGNYDGYVDPVTGANNLGASAQYDVPEVVRNSFGPLSSNIPHRARVDGFYTFDLKEAGSLTLGTAVRFQSGYPISLKASSNRFGPNAVYVLPRGAGGRVEANYTWNLSLGYAYPLPRDLELEVAVRWFNVTNAKAALRVDEIYSFDNARAVAGGDLRDLKHAKIQSSANPGDFFQRQVLSPQGNYGVRAQFQNPTSAQFDVILRF